MASVGFIFPHQLFKNHPVLDHCKKVYLIEDSLFFGDKHTQLKFHKKKIIFHRASMKAYFKYLEGLKITVEYIEYEPGKTIVDIIDRLKPQHVICVDPTDYLLERRLKRSLGDTLTFLISPLFINTREENKKWHEHNQKYFMQEFYKYQRRKLNILINSDGTPTGGRWSFDNENRKKIPKSEITKIPQEPQENTNQFIKEARKYVLENFSNNYGLVDTFWYPITHQEAQTWPSDFLKIRFEKFGVYEDAMISGQNILYHSVLSPLLNVGLLEPIDVINQALAFAEKNNIPINSLEGFIRQIIGWREYIRMLYEHEGSIMRNNNNWSHKRKLGLEYWAGDTGIQPIDESIHRILKTGYGHHIERLMLHGNFLFLNEINPDDVYTWFMEMFIDSYDWVMVPNVYGMTQNTSHGLMATKPYISGSNYVSKMSNYKKGEWNEIWDALYWSFIIKHLDNLTENGRMFFVTNRAAKFSQEQKEKYEKTKQEFYNSQKRIQNLPGL